MPEVISRGEARQKGLKRYFTGEPCKHGHVAERYTAGNGCVMCGGIKSDDWTKRNPQKKLEHLRAHVKANKRKHLEHGRAWAKRNAKKVAEKERRYYYKRKHNKYIKLVEDGKTIASDRGILMDLSEAIEIFKTHDNAFDFIEEDFA